MRLFVAAAVPAAVRRHLAAWRRRLSLPSAVRWTAPGKVHLTLRFLGDTPAHQVTSLAQVLDDAGHQLAPLELQVDRCGSFPTVGPPRVLWVGFRDDAGCRRLYELQADVERRLQQAGIAAEPRPFQPHLTLARVPATTGVDADAWRRLPSPTASLRLRDLHLMRSDAGPSGPAYTTMHTARLGDSE